MANKRYKPEEIVSKLRQVEVLVGQGMARVDAIHKVGISEQTYYRWRKQYGGMGTDQLREPKRLQRENERLRRAVSDLTLDTLIKVQVLYVGVAKRGRVQARLKEHLPGGVDPVHGGARVRIQQKPSIAEAEKSEARARDCQ